MGWDAGWSGIDEMVQMGWCRWDGTDGMVQMGCKG